MAERGNRNTVREIEGVMAGQLVYQDKEFTEIRGNTKKTVSRSTNH